MERTVFVVDESSTLRSLVCNLVRQNRWAAVDFDDVGAALEAAHRQRPDAVLMDYGLSHVLGHDTRDRLKRTLGLSTPVIMMTELNRPDVIARYNQLGADDVLPKPVNALQLANKLRAIDPAASPYVDRRFGRSALVIESRPGSSDRVCEALIGMGYRVTCVSGPGEALRALRSGLCVDAVIALPSAQTEGWAESIGQIQTMYCNKIVAVQPPKAAGPGGGPPGHASQWVVLDATTAPVEIARRTNQLLNVVGIDLSSNKRVPFFAVAHFRSMGGKDWRSGYTHDLSAKGLFVRTLTPCAVSSEVEVRLTLPKRPEVLVEGVVAWARPYAKGQDARNRAGLGIHLTRMSSEYRAAIEELLAAGAEADPTWLRALRGQR